MKVHRERDALDGPNSAYWDSPLSNSCTRKLGAREQKLYRLFHLLRSNRRFPSFSHSLYFDEKSNPIIQKYSYSYINFVYSEFIEISFNSTEEKFNTSSINFIFQASMKFSDDNGFTNKACNALFNNEKLRKENIADGTFHIFVVICKKSVFPLATEKHLKVERANFFLFPKDGRIGNPKTRGCSHRSMSMLEFPCLVLDIAGEKVVCESWKKI